MTTINISLPEKLKDKAQELIDEGLYVSFSDLVRDSIRQIVNKNKYELMIKQAKKDEKAGKLIVLNTDKDIEDYFDSL